MDHVNAFPAGDTSDEQAAALMMLAASLPSEVMDYDYGPRTPYAVQLRTIALMVENERGYNLNGLGTGKTFCALAAFDVLRKAGKLSRMLVVAPLSTLHFTWVREVLMAFPHLRAEVLHGSKEKRLEALERDADVYIINHDGLKTIYDELLWRNDIDALTIDELAVYRNGASARTKLMREFARHKSWVWGMTGSPMPRSVTDIWGQCSIITPSTVPKYFNHFRQTLQYKDGPYTWQNRKGAVEHAVGVMRPSVRFSLDEVTELPPIVMQYVETEMGRRQAQIYKALKQKAVALVQGAQIDALNAGAVMSKLLQIAIGWVYARDGQVVQLDNQARIDAILEHIDGTANKALVFLPFKHALNGVSAALKKEGIKHFKVYGDTPPSDRNRVFDAFQHDPRRYPLLAHPACLAHGITLTAADTVIWGGPTTSLEIFQQANARIRRIGQTRKQLVVMLGGTPIERHVYNILSGNDATQLQFLALLSEVSKN